ncbi:hypothetical protein Taro_017344 [Colocasia esculenta]|uniref:Fungal lipase-type domain-containing protein n=1 Tax=Colocasia esculenta TaxID=4460 RepID=A0A843UQY1_COLES|nr:hypothetical protein [Colocasia esculenta]
MEGLCFRPSPALLGMPAPPLAAINVDVRTSPHHHSPFQACAAGRKGAAAGSAMEAAGEAAGSRHSYAYARPLRKLWPEGAPSVRNDELEGVEERKEGGEEEERQSEEVEEEEDAAARIERRRRAGNWVFKILRARLAWSAEDGKGEGKSGGDGVLQNNERWPSYMEDRDRMLQVGDLCAGCCGEEESGSCHVVDSEGEMELDRDAFARLLRRVPLKEARLFAQLSYLGRLAYNIPRIKSAKLLEYHRLRFATSSLEKKQELPNDDKVLLASQDQELGRRQKLPNVENVQSPRKDQGLEKEQELPNAEKVKLAIQELQQQEDKEGCRESGSQQKNDHLITASSAYKVAASAASYLQSQTRSILPFRSASSKLGLSLTGVVSEDGDRGLTSSEVVSFVATTNSVTAVVAAKEETKQAVAKDLNSSISSPCEWFICDDENSKTRFFVIQGSESVASWQANLLFEPIQFEGMDVMVHRGIYETAKGIYQQMLPHVRSHLTAYGSSATFRFTGHSLGGSLSLLVSLMLLTRGEVPPSSLLPVVTFGSPYIMCGGDHLLQKLALPLNYVKAVMMHRDIVPRAFSCNYPDHVTEILKAVNGKFRNHPCLRNQRLLYAPMGQFLILQPEEKHSPHHDLLPTGTGLYVLRHKSPNSRESARILRLAQSLFLNTPHPLEILSDRAAYGSEGTVCRDHDVNGYLTSLRSVICQELMLIRKHKREQRRRRRQMLRPLMPPQGINTSTMMDRQTGPENSRPLHQSFSIVIQGGMQSLRRLGRFVSSRDVHMLVLLLPSRTLLLEVLKVTGFT